MSYKLLLCRSSGNIDITGIAENITWGDNIDTLGMDFNFEYSYPDVDYLTKIKVNLGDILVLHNGTDEVFRGIIKDEGFGDRTKRPYTAYDYAFYLNKNDVVIQFNGITASSAIGQLCNKVKVPIGYITPINTKIKKIYKDQKISDVIKDILEQAERELGIKYRLEMRRGKLCIEPYSDLIVVAKYKLAKNLNSFDATKAANISGTRSIDELKNHIIVTASGEDTGKIKAEAKDTNSISKYGLLQEVETVDDINIAQARNIASKKLAELNKITESFSMDMLGSDNIRAGRVLYVKDEYNELDAYYLIKSCSHALSNGNHTINLEMGTI